MKHIRRLACVFAGLWLALVTTGVSQSSRPAETASAAAGDEVPSASAPVERTVRWHAGLAAARQEAAKESRPLLVVLHDPDAPASETFQIQTLADEETRRFLADFSAARLDARSGEGKKLLTETGETATPVTLVLGADGELLDSLPGCIVPAERFRRRLARSLEYWQAATARPTTSASQWRAALARLNLSTRAKAAPAIDALLKVPPDKLPEGVTVAMLHLARGRALELAEPDRAGADLSRARELAPGDAAVGGEALLATMRIAKRAAQYKQAHELCRQYIETYPKGPGIGEAYYAKAVIECSALDDRAAAVETLEGFISAYSDDPGVVAARALLEALK